MRSFIQAQPYIDIDPYILESTAAWILNHQKLSGEFEEPGRVLHTKLQGGTSDSVSRTAYILTALLEYQFNEVVIIVILMYLKQITVKLFTIQASALNQDKMPKNAFEAAVFSVRQPILFSQSDFFQMCWITHLISFMGMGCIRTSAR